MSNSTLGQDRLLRMFRNFGSLTAGKTLGDLFAFLLFVVFSRLYGQEGIGQYSFAMALAGFFMVLSDFGLELLSIKEMSRQKGPLVRYFSGILSLRLIQTSVSYALLLVLAAILPVTHETKLVIVVIGAYQLIYKLIDGFAAVFVAREDMHRAAFLVASLRVGAALLAVGAALSGASLVMALMVMPLVGIVQAAIGYVMVARYHGAIHLFVSREYFKNTLSEAAPYALSEFLRQLSTRTDVVLLGFLLGMAAAGIYNVAYRVIFLLVPLSYFGALTVFPLASRLFVESSRGALTGLYHKTLSSIVIVGLPSSFGLWLIAPNLIPLLFGEGFAESVLVLQVLAWLFFLSCLKFVMQVFLMACNRQREMTRNQWTAAWLNIIGTVLLIKLFGIVGAAVATLVSETALVLLYAARLRDMLGWPQIGSRLAMSGIATATFVIPFELLSTSNLLAVIPASILLYLGTLVLFKDIRHHELRVIARLFARRQGGETPGRQ